jgi:hypothetical protein
MGRISLMLKNVKENKEIIEQAKEAGNTTKLPPGLLGFNKEDAKNEIDHFIKQNKADEHNEKFPVAAFQRRQSEILLKKEEENKN